MLKKQQKEPSEKEIERRFRDKIEKMGGICIKLYTLTISGLPDRLILMPKSKFYLAELKKMKNGKPTSLSPLQQFMRRRLHVLGFHVWVIYDEQTTELFTDKLLKDQL